MDGSGPDVCLLPGGCPAGISQGSLLEKLSSQMVLTEAAVSCQILSYPNYDVLMGSALGRWHVLGLGVLTVTCG